MRDCYKKFWKNVFVSVLQDSLPQFLLKESAARKAADELKPSGKPIELVWNPVDKLTFKLIVTSHPRQDYFWAFCQWSEKGRGKFSGVWHTLFSDAAWDKDEAVVYLQGLSMELDPPEHRVIEWKIWEPNFPVGDTREEHQAYMAACTAEELRVVGDEEAFQRVEVAARKAVADIKRCAMPWFEKKLEWYLCQKDRNA